MRMSIYSQGTKRPKRLTVHELTEATLHYLEADLPSWKRLPGLKLDADHWRVFCTTKRYPKRNYSQEKLGADLKLFIPIEDKMIAYIKPQRYSEVSVCILMQISTYLVRRDGRRVSTFSVTGLHFQHVRESEPLVSDIFDTITTTLSFPEEHVREDTYARRETYNYIPPQLDITAHISHPAAPGPSLRISDAIVVPEEAHVQIEPFAIVDDDTSSEAIVPHMHDKHEYICTTVALESLSTDSNLEKTRKRTFHQSLVTSPGICRQVDMATPRCGIGTQCFLDERSKHLSNSLLIDERNKDTQPLAKEVTSDVPYQIIRIPHLLRSMSLITEMSKSSNVLLRSIEPAWKNCEPFFMIIDDQRTFWDPDISKFKTPDFVIHSLPSIPSALLSPTPNRFAHIVQTTKSQTRGRHSEALSNWTYCIIANYEVLSGRGSRDNSTILTRQEHFVISPESCGATPFVSTTYFYTDVQHIAKIDANYIRVVWHCMRIAGVRSEDIAAKTTTYDLHISTQILLVMFSALRIPHPDSTTTKAMTHNQQISAQCVRNRIQVANSVPYKSHTLFHIRSRSPFEDFITYTHDHPTRLEFSQLHGPVVRIASETSIFHSPRLSALESSFNVSNMKYKASDSVVDDTGQVFEDIQDGGRKETDECNGLDGVRINCLKSALFHDLHGTHAQPFDTHARNARVTYRSTSYRTVQHINQLPCIVPPPHTLDELSISRTPSFDATSFFKNIAPKLSKISQLATHLTSIIDFTALFCASKARCLTHTTLTDWEVSI